MNKTDLETVGAMHQCEKGAAFSTCTHCGAMAEELAKPCPHFMQQAGELLHVNAVPAVGAGGVPSGYALVPLEPTPEMLACKDSDGFTIMTGDEYYFRSMEDAHHFAAALYRAMLAAAPPLPAAKGQEPADALIRQMVDALARSQPDSGTNSDWEAHLAATAAGRAALASQQPTEQGGGL